jgi:hypothetical protein
MFTTLLRVSAAVGPSAIWIAKFCAVVMVVFVLYIGVVIGATLHAADAEQRKVRYQIFRDLLDLFRRGNSK